MKKIKTFTVKKLLFYIFIIIVVGVFLYTQMLKPNKTQFSFKNTGYFGNALYYDTLKELGYEVSYSLKPISHLKNKGLVVLNVASANYELTDIDYEGIADFVMAGGKLLVLFQDMTLADSETPENEGFKPILNELEGQPYDKWESENGGVLMYGSIYITSNLTLNTDREAAYRTLQMLHPYIAKEGIVFNEYYLVISQGKRSLWKETPQGVKVTLIELLLAFLFFIWYKGKRFGAPLKLYEEIEPDENQYAKAVGSLYYQSGHWEVLLDSYYQQLLNKIYRKYLLYMDVGEENWISIFEEGKEKEYRAAKKVRHFMNAYHEGTLKGLSKRKMKKSTKEILVAIQFLEKSLDQ